MTALLCDSTVAALPNTAQHGCIPCCCRCCLAARKDDLIKYGRKLLKSETALWRDPEIIAEILGLAEDTEHRGNILADIESKFTDKKVYPSSPTFV